MIERIVVINDLSKGAGGASALAIASAAAFRRDGHAVTFLAGDSAENPELATLGVEMKGLGAGRLLERGAAAMATGLYNRAAYRMVRDWIAANDAPGVVYHLHGWSQTFSPSVFHALRPVAGRLVLSAHDFFLACPNGAYSFFDTGRRCTLVPMSLACIVANCDRRSYAQKIWRVARHGLFRSLWPGRAFPPVLMIHEDMRRAFELSGVPSERLRAVPNPVVPYTRERIRAEENEEFVFIGRLEATKGPDLAAAAARLAGAPMRFIGEGVMADELRARYPEMIFSGRRPREDIHELLGNARALVMPSRYPEPFGLVAVEAIWSGLPVIAAETALLAPSIEAAGAGFGCDPKNVEALAAKISAIRASDTLCRTLSEQAFFNTRDLALSPGDWIATLLAVYEEVLESNTESLPALGQAPRNVVN